MKSQYVIFICLWLPLATLGLELQGEWRQGHVLRGQVEPGSELHFQGRKVPVAVSGDFVLGLGRDAPDEVELTLSVKGKEPVVHRFAVAKRDYQIQSITGVPQQTVTPSPEQVQRTREEAARVYQARQQVLPATDYKIDFIWPLTGRITGVYGSQRIYNGEPRAPHYGVDIARPTGTPVRAPAPGVVTLVEPDLFYSGGTLIVDHGHGLSSTFIHLSAILVAVGDRVEQGEEIAEVGASGRATGPHLDWRMNWFDERVDPVSLVGPMPGDG